MGSLDIQWALAFLAVAISIAAHADTPRPRTLCPTSPSVFCLRASMAQYEQWDQLPAVSDDYGRGRDVIVRRIDALIEELSKGSRSPS